MGGGVNFCMQGLHFFCVAVPTFEAIFATGLSYLAAGALVSVILGIAIEMPELLAE